MEQHQHGHIYRAQEDKHLMRDYGVKPAQEVRQNLQAELKREKEKFLALQRIRQRSQERSRGHGR